MRLLRLQRIVRAVSALLVLATALGLPHLAQDDRACVSAGAFVEHDASKHGLGPAQKADRDHCAVCHFTRTLRSPRAAVAVAVAPVPGYSPVHHPVTFALLPPALDHVPARAPPAPQLRPAPEFIRVGCQSRTVSTQLGARPQS